MADNNLKITVNKNGPLMVEGQVKVVDHEDNVLKEKEKVFLCRCGASEKKPFCDGSHNRVGFEG